MEILKGSLGFKGNKGETGEIGTPVPYEGTFEQLKNSNVDKFYNYIILDSSDVNYEGHWVYYDRKESKWKDGGLYLSHQLTTEIKNKINLVENEVGNNTVRQDLLEQKYDEQIKNIASSEPQNAEIVDARQGFDTLGLVIKQKVYHFQNIEAMKNCLTLIPGDVVQTLGYYCANDEGCGKYLIRLKVETDVEDGGSIHFLNNNLVAELINEKDINIKQFGAKSFSVTSESTINYEESIDIPLNNAIAYILKLATNNGNKSYNFNLIFPAGNYVIEDTIQVSPLVHLIPNGSVALYFNSNEDKVMFEISTLNSELDPYARNDLWGRFGNPIIGGENGNFEILNMNDISINTAFKIGGITEKSVTEMTGLKNVSVKKFNVGLELYLNNVYLNKFEGLRIDTCNIGVKTTCSNPPNAINSGENILFEKGSISICKTAILFNDCIVNLKFSDYSFDGNGCLVYQNLNLNAQIILDKCWIEAIGNSMGSGHKAINYEGKQAIVYIKPCEGTIQAYQRTNYIFNDCRYVDSTSIYEGSELKYLFSGNTLTLSLINFSYQTWENYSNTTPKYLCDTNVTHIYYKNSIPSAYANTPFIKQKNLMQYPDFQKTTNGVLSSLEVGTEVGKDLTIYAISNIASLEIVADEFSGTGKLLKITRNNVEETSSLQLYTKFKIYGRNANLLGRMFVKNEDDTRTGITQNFRNRYYDCYNNDLGIQSYNTYKENYWKKDENGFWHPTYIQNIDYDHFNNLNASYCKSLFTLAMSNTASQVVYVKLPEIFDTSGTAIILKDELNT